MSPILNCIRGGFNRGLNYSLIFHPRVSGGALIFFARGSGMFFPWLLLSSSGSSRGWGGGGFSSGGGGFSGGGGSFGGGGAGGSW
jgi:uncharacterized membrane protein YgcG